MARIPISKQTERRIREDAHQRCGFCQCQQEYSFYRLTIEHIIPRSNFAPNDPQMHAESNLWLSCQTCNSHKSSKTHATDPVSGEQVSLFNPRTQDWNDHFQWSEDGVSVVGTTPIGRATVTALKLDSDPTAIRARTHWVRVGWHPPKD